MTSLIYFIIVLIVGCVCWYLVSPLLDASSKFSPSLSNLQLNDLYIRKDEILHSIKDLEADYYSNKISEKDYNRMYQEAMFEATKILKTIENHAEQNVDSIKTDDDQIKTCPVCKIMVTAEAKFCMECGQKL